jgi:hypothetical protein
MNSIKTKTATSTTTSTGRLSILLTTKNTYIINILVMINMIMMNLINTKSITTTKSTANNTLTANIVTIQDNNKIKYNKTKITNIFSYCNNESTIKLIINEQYF